MPAQQKQVGGGRASIGDIAPKLAALITSGDAAQLRFHLGRAKENGVTETELVEAITHLTFYAGWPKGMTAANVAREVFAG